MAIGRGDASIGPSWAPCEVSAELSIVGAASGGSDVRAGAARVNQGKFGVKQGSLRVQFSE